MVPGKASSAIILNFQHLAKCRFLAHLPMSVYMLHLRPLISRDLSQRAPVASRIQL